MVRHALFASVLTLATVLGFTQLSPTSAEAAGECKHPEFKTKMVKEACAKGGQKAAKEAMKGFLKEAKAKLPKKITGCPSCHTKVGGDFPLKPVGLDLFKEAGGELLPAKTK